MGLLVNIFVVVIRFLNFIMLPFLHISEYQKNTLNHLLMISATKLAKMIRQRKVSSESVIRSYITRITEVNPLINAVVEDRFEEALEDAKFVDNYLETTLLIEDELQKIKPLLGVPFTVKASCQLSEMDVGINIRRGMKADTDGYAVAQIKSAAAIPLLVSNTPESSLSWYCHNKVTGTTCNPYPRCDEKHWWLLRWRRIISMEGHVPYPRGEKMLDYFTIGPITRYAEDLRLLMSIMIAPGADSLRLYETVDLTKLLVYSLVEIPKSFIVPGVDIGMKRAIESAVQFLEKRCNCAIMKENNFENNFKDSFLSSIYLL